LVVIKDPVAIPEVGSTGVVTMMPIPGATADELAVNKENVPPENSTIDFRASFVKTVVCPVPSNVW
jgi:hypothetical protein